MFKGKFNHTIDSKNRIIVPVKLRNELGDSFVITVGLEGCLYIFPKEEWENFILELRKLPGEKKARDLIRWFMSCASDCELDPQGRILIQNDLVIKAELKKDVVFAGNINKVELWSKERWDEMDSAFNNMDEVAEELATYGITF